MKNSMFAISPEFNCSISQFFFSNQEIRIPVFNARRLQNDFGDGRKTSYITLVYYLKYTQKQEKTIMKGSIPLHKLKVHCRTNVSKRAWADRHVF